MKTKLIYALLIIVITFVGYTLFLPRLRPTPISINEISATGTVILAFSPPTLAISPSSSTSSIADLNGSGKVDIFDYNTFVSDYGKTGAPGFVPADMTKDGTINIFDYNLLVANFGK